MHRAKYKQRGMSVAGNASEQNISCCKAIMGGTITFTTGRGVSSSGGEGEGVVSGARHQTATPR